MKGLSLIVLIILTLNSQVFALEVGQKCPTLPGFSDSISKFEGKVLLIDFWASWCSSCEKSFSWLSKLQNSYGDKGLQVVTVNLDNKKEDAYKILDSTKNSFVVTFDPEGQIASAYKIDAMPTSILVDKNGNVVEIFNNGINEKEKRTIEEKIRSLLGS